jgi:multiple sugar transport system ATP-binding protein
MASISINNVWKYYGQTPAVKDLSIECADGSFVSILGPSGCGKSSTMRMLAGLEHISAGDILFDGERVNDLAPRDRDIAMVFENYALYPHKSVFENMANPLKLHGIDSATIKERVTGAARLLEIDHLLDRRPQELSGGQKQRVAIGRAIVREPKLFLFDEPIAHLDAKLRAHMRGEIKHLQRSLGTTMIYVTHDQLEALSMADMIAVMYEGELQQWGTPREIFNNPVNAWVAGFVGEPSMNFLTCDVRREGDTVAFAHPNFAIPVTAAQSGRLNGSGNGGTVRMGVRPDALAITLVRPEGPCIEGSIFVTELLGGDMLVDVQLSDARVRVKTSTEFAGASGDACYLTVNREKWHAFSVETGRAYF